MIDEQRGGGGGGGANVLAIVPSGQKS